MDTVTSRFLVSDAGLDSASNGAVDIEERSIPGGAAGAVSVRIVRPKGATETLAAIIYVHGGSWSDREIRTDHRLISAIANAAHAAVIFVSRRGHGGASRAMVLEKSYAAAKFVAEDAPELNVDASRIGIVGDSAGGDLTAPLALLAQQRGFPTFRYQVLLTSASEASSYRGSSKRIAAGPWVARAMVESDRDHALNAA